MLRHSCFRFRRIAGLLFAMLMILVLQPVVDAQVEDDKKVSEVEIAPELVIQKGKEAAIEGVVVHLNLKADFLQDFLKVDTEAFKSIREGFPEMSQFWVESSLGNLASLLERPGLKLDDHDGLIVNGKLVAGEGEPSKPVRLVVDFVSGRIELGTQTGGTSSTLFSSAVQINWDDLADKIEGVSKIQMAEAVAAYDTYKLNQLAGGVTAYLDADLNLSETQRQSVEKHFLDLLQNQRIARQSSGLDAIRNIVHQRWAFEEVPDDLSESQKSKWKSFRSSVLSRRR